MMAEADRFTDVFRRHYGRVLAYALRRVDEPTAHDVVAETFLAAWRHVDRLPAEPLPWLYRTAANSIANQTRGRRRRGRLAGRVATEARAAVPDHADRVVDAARLRAALGGLSRTDREALLLVAWEGLDHRAAAYAMGCSPTTFRVRLHRARKRLARLLHDHPATVVGAITLEEF